MKKKKLKSKKENCFSIFSSRIYVNVNSIVIDKFINNKYIQIIFNCIYSIFKKYFQKFGIIFIFCERFDLWVNSNSIVINTYIKNKSIYINFNIAYSFFKKY